MSSINQSYYSLRDLSQSKLFRIVSAFICMGLLVAACGGREEPTPVPTATPIPATATPEPAATEPAPPEAPAEEAAATEPEAEPTDTVQEESADASEAAMTEEVAGEVAPDVFFRMPTENAIVPPTFTVVMGAVGISVDPAGDIVENSGHMHILVDTDFIEAGNVIPKDDQHLHFGDGSLTTELTLTPGSHTLRLQLADGAHIALEGDVYRDEVVVTVKEGAPAQSVRFSSPVDGAVVPPNFDVNMAASGFFVDPAGKIIEGSGHMHILVDTDFIEPGSVIPNDAAHLHFGKAQLATSMELMPGEHTLRLQLANGAHIALEGDEYRDEITIFVEEGAASQSVRFVEPADGATVGSTFDVKMSATGLFVEGAGAVLREQGGHMHILVDTDFIEPGNVIPKDDQHIHFGGGQTLAELTLEPGEHTLRLQMANGAHIAFDGEQYRAEINVIVSDDGAIIELGETREETIEEAADDADAGTALAATDSDAMRSPSELRSNLGCTACHNSAESHDPANPWPTGPHQASIHEYAGERVAGMSADEYLYESIVDPCAFLVEGYATCIMPQNYGEQMSDGEIRSLVAWLLDPNRSME